MIIHNAVIALLKPTVAFHYVYQGVLGGERCFWVITLHALCIKSERRSMASWQTRTIRDFLCHAPGWLGSIQVTSAWLYAWVGQCSRTELGGWECCHLNCVTARRELASTLSRETHNWPQRQILLCLGRCWEEKVMLHQQVTHGKQGNKGHWIRMCPGATVRHWALSTSSPSASML